MRTGGFKLPIKSECVWSCEWVEFGVLWKISSSSNSASLHFYMHNIIMYMAFVRFQLLKNATGNMDRESQSDHIFNVICVCVWIGIHLHISQCPCPLSKRHSVSWFSWVHMARRLLFFHYNSKDAACESSYVPNCLLRKNWRVPSPSCLILRLSPYRDIHLNEFSISWYTLWAFKMTKKVYSFSSRVSNHSPLSPPQRLLYPLQFPIDLGIKFQMAGTCKKTHIEYHILPFPST